MLLHGHGWLVPPFTHASNFSIVGPTLLPFAGATASEFEGALTIVRHAAAEAQADVVAVSWGPWGDFLVAELACLGMRAIDIGNLIDILGEYEGEIDIDSMNVST